MPGVARRLEEPPDIQGVVVTETAGVRVGVHDQRGTKIRQGHLEVELGRVGQDCAGRNIHGRQEQCVNEAGYLVEDEVTVGLVGYQTSKLGRGEDVDRQRASALSAGEPVSRLAVVAQSDVTGFAHVVRTPNRWAPNASAASVFPRATVSAQTLHG